VPIFATLAFTGMRIGKLQQLRWENVDFDLNVIHMQQGGSDGKPKDREDRFIPVHGSKLKPILQALLRISEQVFLMPDGRLASPKKLRAYLKSLCKQCGFENPKQYKLHTFRHFFASYCAQQNLSYKYVLEWMGHSSSAILDMYFTMNDRQAHRAMNSLSFNSEKLENRIVRCTLPTSTSATYTFLTAYRTPLKINGEGGIRTRGTHKGYTGFRNRLDKPLRHLSRLL
jgi:integrase